MNIVWCIPDCGELYFFHRLVYKADDTFIPPDGSHLDPYGRILNHTDGTRIAEYGPHIPAEQCGQAF